MSSTENRRAWVLASADLRTNAEVAAALGLSVRQVQRLKKALREEGPAGLAHGNRGRSVAHTLPEELAGRVVALYKDKYPGFNFSHFHEKLVEDEGLTVSRSSVGRILKAAGQVSPKKRRAAKHRSRRERRASEGAMLQIDGSPHDWLEGRGPRLCLLGAIDDATGKVPGALFREHEDAQGYFLLMRGIVRKQGIPETVYRDRHGIFERDAREKESLIEQLEGRRAPTQFGRLMEELGVRQIAAHSPQAKGRIERLWATFQDRLVSELRLAKASDIQSASVVLKRVLADHNQRFHRMPGDPRSLYRKPQAGKDMDKLFCFKYQRCVAKDNTVAFFGDTIQIRPGAGRRSYSGCRVDVHERFDGSVHIYYQDVCVAKTPTPAIPPPVLRVRHSNGRFTEERPRKDPKQIANANQAPPEPAEPKTRKPYKPGPDHPWRRSYMTKSQTT